MIGTQFAHYRLIEKLGSGGMGEVYLADDTELGRWVAIKFIPPAFATSGDVIERFRREARAAAALRHPNIITIHGVGTHDGRPYIVMEHVDGDPLSKWIERGDLSIEQSLEITAQILDGLAAAHGAGVVHRDIKPANILIDHGGRVSILDFGLARLRGAAPITAEASTMGTVQYMSPEQTRSAKVDERSDLFSTGVVLYEMVTGCRPFTGEDRAAVLESINTGTPPPLRSHNRGASRSLEQIVAKLLARKPEERYPNAKAALEAIRREQHAAGLRAGARKRRRIVAALAAALGGLAWIAVWLAGKR